MIAQIVGARHWAEEQRPVSLEDPPIQFDPALFLHPGDNGRAQTWSPLAPSQPFELPLLQQQGYQIPQPELLPPNVGSQSPFPDYIRNMIEADTAADDDDWPFASTKARNSMPLTGAGISSGPQYRASFVNQPVVPQPALLRPDSSQQQLVADDILRYLSEPDDPDEIYLRSLGFFDRR